VPPGVDVTSYKMVGELGMMDGWMDGWMDGFTKGRMMGGIIGRKVAGREGITLKRRSTTTLPYPVGGVS
jgi:hypothetical protein